MAQLWKTTKGFPFMKSVEASLGARVFFRSVEVARKKSGPVLLKGWFERCPSEWYLGNKKT